MKLQEIKTALTRLKTITFQLPNGSLVPPHFHVTEVGKITKHFIDCGGVVRKEEVVNFQLWNANDYNHRLHPEKLIQIIEIAEQNLGIENLEIEVEYQGQTIEKFGLAFDGTNFNLTTKQTDCLAKDKCEVPEEPKFISLGESHSISSCTPGSGCC